MSSSSSAANRSKSSDKQSHETSETVYQSNSIVPTNKVEKTVKHSHHLKPSPPPDQVSKHSPHARQKRSLNPFSAPSLQSNFFAQSSSLRSSARPFEEVAILQGDVDMQNGAPIKTTGNPTPWTDKKS